jgi:hypothetical protein
MDPEIRIQNLPLLALFRILACLPRQDCLRMRLMCREFREASIPMFRSLHFNKNTRIPPRTRLFVRQLEALTAVTQVVIVDRCEPCYNILKADRAVSKLSSLTLELSEEPEFPMIAVKSIARRLTRATQLTKLAFNVPAMAPTGKQATLLCSIIHSCQALGVLHWLGGSPTSLPAALRGVTSLHTLRVHPPMIQGFLMSVSELTRLKELDAVHLDSDHDADALSALTQLTYLNVFGSWDGMPAQISKLCSMQVFYFFSFDTLHPSITQRALSSMTLLRELILCPFCSRDLASWDSLVASLPSLTALVLGCRPPNIGQDEAYAFPQIVDPNGFGRLRHLTLVVMGARFEELYEFLSRLV